MTKYTTTLTWPKASKQAVYSESIIAQTKAEALLYALRNARQEGWTGTPIKQEARIAREVEE